MAGPWVGAQRPGQRAAGGGDLIDCMREREREMVMGGLPNTSRPSAGDPTLRWCSFPNVLHITGVNLHKFDRIYVHIYIYTHMNVYIYIE